MYWLDTKVKFIMLMKTIEQYYIIHVIFHNIEFILILCNNLVKHTLHTFDNNYCILFSDETDSSDQATAESYWSPGHIPNSPENDPAFVQSEEFFPSSHGLVQTHPATFSGFGSTCGLKYFWITLFLITRGISNVYYWFYHKTLVFWCSHLKTIYRIIMFVFVCYTLRPTSNIKLNKKCYFSRYFWIVAQQFATFGIFVIRLRQKRFGRITQEPWTFIARRMRESLSRRRASQNMLLSLHRRIIQRPRSVSMHITLYYYKHTRTRVCYFRSLYRLAHTICHT